MRGFSPAVNMLDESLEYGKRMKTCWVATEPTASTHMYHEFLKEANRYNVIMSIVAFGLKEVFVHIAIVWIPQ